jgi:mannitol/fructose-specific phosphotransferase system IIA component (Ntr-type)
VQRWIGERGLPAAEVNGAYRAEPSRLLEWLLRNPLPDSPERMPIHDDDEPSRIHESLQAGVVAYDVGGTSKVEVLARIAGLIPPVSGVRTADLREALTREDGVSSAYLAEGIALPNPGRPLVYPASAPVMALCFLGWPVPWGSHGEPAHTVFVLVAPSICSHYFLLSRLLFAVHQPRFRDAVRHRVPEWEILAAARAAEEFLTPAAAPGGGV